MFSLEAIIQFVKKHFQWRDVLFLLVVIGLFLLTRITNLDKWPQFSDEGIYIDWAKTAWKDAAQRFISVTDGRQPLQTWGTIPFLKIFSPNDLFAGRMFSVTTGFAALLGMISLTYYLWGKKAAYVSSLLYVFLPSFVFYDRMALVDSGVNAGFIWILFFSILLVRQRRLDLALIMGFIGGIALLAKSSSRMFLGLTAAAPILYLDLWKKDKKTFVSQTMNYLFLLGIVAAISLLFYYIQMLSPYMHYVELKNTTFIMTRAEFMAEPFKFFKNNIGNIPLYVAWEAGWVIVISSIIGYILLMKKDRKLALYLSVFVFVPYIAIAFFAKVLFPRYVLFFASLLVIFATYYFINLKNKRQLMISFIVLLVSMNIFNYALIFDPVRASFPPVDRGQYVEGSTAVWGAEDLMNMMKENAKNRNVLVLAEGDFGLVGQVLKVYDQPDDNVDILGLWPLTEAHLYDFQSDLGERDIYVVYSHRDEFPPSWPIELVKEYTKPGNKESLYLFKLLPPSNP